jgi:hypothetical protein
MVLSRIVDPSVAVDMPPAAAVAAPAPAPVAAEVLVEDFEVAVFFLGRALVGTMRMRSRMKDVALSNDPFFDAMLEYANRNNQRE